LPRKTEYDGPKIVLLLLLLLKWYDKGMMRRGYLTKVSFLNAEEDESGKIFV
jgi:hypothetical protein